MGNKHSTKPITLNDVIKYRNFTWEKACSEEYTKTTSKLNKLNPHFVFDNGTVIVIDIKDIKDKLELYIDDATQKLFKVKVPKTIYGTTQIDGMFCTQTDKPHILCNNKINIKSINTYVSNNIKSDNADKICKYIIDGSGNILCYDLMWKEYDEPQSPTYSENNI